jgi:hypothetical protein
MDTVIVTVPHAKCRGAFEQHWCDLTADFNAYFLCRLVQTVLPKARVSLVRADKVRQKCDENRIQSRETHFRQEIDSLIDPGRTILLDVHSFPPDEESFGLAQDPEIVLLYLDRIRVTADLVRALHDAGVVAVALQGTNENDILYKARQDVKYAVLLEFNENLSNRRSLFICNVFARWLKQFGQTWPLPKSS